MGPETNHSMSKPSRKDRKLRGDHVQPKASGRAANQPSPATEDVETSSRRETASGMPTAPSSVRVERRQQRAEQLKRQRIIRMAAGVAIAIVVLALAWGAYRWYMGPDVSADVVTYFDVETANAIHPEDDIVILYEQIPPVGGPHNAAWQTCGFYDEYIYNWHGVHSMEHGAVWITYDPELPQDQIDTLRRKADQGYVLVSPYPGMDAPVVASVWGKQIRLDGADDERLDAFIKQYRLNSDNTPEPGATCNGGATWTTEEAPQQDAYVQPAGAEATPIGGLTSLDATATAEAAGE
jgi:hypothetical protein